MRKVSNKTIAGFLVVAMILVVSGTIFNLNRFGGFNSILGGAATAGAETSGFGIPTTLAAGEVGRIVVVVENNLDSDREYYIQALLLSTEGKVVASADSETAIIPAGAKSEMKMYLDLEDAAPGKYQLELTVYREGELLKSRLVDVSIVRKWFR